MKVAVMQPYFFPYLGYFQLINAADIFVVYDDVNFIKQSWITRNSILVNGEATRINLIIEGASSFKKINEINRISKRNKWLKTIEQSYKKAPLFNTVFPLIEDIAMHDEKCISKYLMQSLQKIAAYLDMQTTFKLSSEIEKDNDLTGQDKVLAICEALQATKYINAIGGQKLYSKADFNAAGMALHFIDSKPSTYKQFDAHFIASLSIIDVLMFNTKAAVKDLLNQYELI